MTASTKLTPTMVVAGATTKYLAAPGGPGKGRLRYLEAGEGDSTIVLLHTVRTQAEHFHRLLPGLADKHHVFALDFPGMGHSEIVPGASYDEPALRAAVVQLIIERDLTDVVLVGESIGAVVALSTAADMPGRIKKVVAVNPYDYRDGLKRSSLLARLIITGVLAPVIGPTLAAVEPKPIMRRILQGGLVDTSALTDDYLDELLNVGRRPGYSAVARAVYGNLPSMIAARERYSAVTADVELVYGERDWSRESDRIADRQLLPAATATTVAGAGHFIALERPDIIAGLVS
ncbi:alpha/beta fold hydrolase [Rhodococcus sp. 077-4]|uniref:alpha/beta fold hydrolase n=1 Tax=Rhodococcus sp. 077-4 TaxID=2789271 RepID=UPI0039F5C416